MKIIWNELTVAPGTHSSDDLLSQWRWLVGHNWQIVLVSSLGDLFLADPAGRIHWLDAGTGRLTEIATSLNEFNQLRQKPANAAEWFVPRLVGDILQSSGRLSPGQCFSSKIAPILGGKMEPGNFEAADLSVHFGTLGQIHRQVKDLPPGTPVNQINIHP